MRYRTAVKTGRTAAMQASDYGTTTFTRYAVMVEPLSWGYVARWASAWPGREARPD